MIGETVSHYKIIEKLGSGGMGEVYLAEDTKLDRRVALKFLPSQLVSDEEFKSRFTREAQAAAKLNHPNIITIYEVSEHDGRPYFAMEYIEGESLREMIKSGGLSLDQAVDIVMQICEGLQAAHDAGIVHRDIKPSNILMDKDGRCRILDFGLAAVQAEEKLTKSGSSLGTVNYMSPEQVQGEKVDYRSDIFSLGVVIYEMITGQLPFKGDYDAAVVYSIINDTPEPLARYKSDLPEGLQGIVSKALEKDREMRYQHIADLLADMKKAKAGTERRIAGKQYPSIAVMPFADMSAGKDQEYFCDGIAEEIINALTRIENLRVLARTSAFSFKGKDIDIREIGRKLNVATLLEGSVRKAGDRLRITAQLINVGDGYHLWSERYDRKMEDIFAIQDEISLSIVENLKVKLAGEEKARLVIKQTGDPEAYNDYLMGQYYMNMTSGENLEKAIDYINRAIDKAPDYSQAYAGLSLAYCTQGFADFLPPKKVFPLAKRAAQKAIEIDPSLAYGYDALGLVKIFYDWDWEGGRMEFEKALRLNPNYAGVHRDYTSYFMAIGKLDEAIVRVKKAIELDPFSIPPNMYLGIYLVRAGRLEEAKEHLQKIIEMKPDFSHSRWLLGQVFILEGRFDEGIDAILRALKISNNMPLLVGALGWAYAVSSRKDEARKIIDELKKREQKEYVRPFIYAKIHSALEEIDLAFEWLDKAYDEHDISLSNIMTDETITNLRSDSRFDNLLRKMKLLK